MMFIHVQRPNVTPTFGYWLLGLRLILNSLRSSGANHFGDFNTTIFTSGLRSPAVLNFFVVKGNDILKNIR